MPPFVHPVDQPPESRKPAALDHQRALVMRATTAAAPTQGRAAVWRVQIAQLEPTFGGGLSPASIAAASPNAVFNHASCKSAAAIRTAQAGELI